MTRIIFMEAYTGGEADTETNQTLKTLNYPEEPSGIEGGEIIHTAADAAPEVPPVEVPGRPETPEHIPEKAADKKVIPMNPNKSNP